MNWLTIDFRPAPSGWRAVGLSNDGQSYARPVAGWLVQVEQDGPFDDRAMEVRERRVVAAAHDCEGSSVLDADDVVADLWCVLGPSDPDPSPEDMARELELRARLLAAVAAASGKQS